MAVTGRPATEADLPHLAALMVPGQEETAAALPDVIRSTPGAFTAPDFLAGLARQLAAPGNALLVAEDGGEVVGTLRKRL